MANRRWMIGILGIVILATFGWAGIYLSARNSSSEREIRQLLGEAYDSQRPGGSRLSGTSYHPVAVTRAISQDLGKAQILLLRMPESNTRRKLQELLYLAAGQWAKFVEFENNSALNSSADSTLANNLGASLLALAADDPSQLLKALDAFQRAGKLDPKAPEPLFNLVLTYRKLRFPKLADETLHRYSEIDAGSAWHKELENPAPIDEADIRDQLEHAIDAGNLAEAGRLFQANPELCRRLAMQFALNAEPESPALIRFIADQIELRYGDRTVSVMIAPLFTEQREAIVDLRALVRSGAALWEAGKYPESLAAYEQAESRAAQTNSLFDHLWIDVNKADTDIRLGNFATVRQTLARVVKVATAQNLRWLKARALMLYGATLRLTSSYTEMLNLIAKADEEFTRLDAPHDRLRVLYYLAAYRYYGGDQDEALKIAMECLSLTKNTDDVRIATVEWLLGSILYRHGMSDKSLLFAKASVERSKNGPYARGVELQAAITLTELYQSLSEYKLADESLKIAEDAFLNVPEGYDQIRYDLILGIVNAKAKLAQRNFAEAESLLQRNLDLYYQQPFSATPLLSQSLMLLADVYSQSGRTQEAGRKLTEAIDVVEKDDEYMKAERLRVKFDDQRRELYDSAIEFEFRNGSIAAAWGYLQRYRAKLFLEFLAVFNSDVEPMRAHLHPEEIQRRIPRDTQVVEYALLKDQLLIWLASDKQFTVRSVPIRRSDLEATVKTALQKLRIEDTVEPVLVELGHWLIDPISDLLDPTRTLTIIPDRALHGLPFGALKQPGKTQYLIQEFPIVVSPSLTHFLTGDGARPARDSVIGFGSQNGGASEFKELSALDGIYAKAPIFVGSRVDKSSFLDGLTKAPVIHYAGHSATDAADPLRSSILLDGNRSGPNSVTAVDISQKRLMHNAIVILSSCDSSVGNSRDGIGVRGLTSAFLIAGAGSVVGSLWPVEASSTADLMIRFHRAFATSGMPVAKALQEAQLEFLKTYPERSHPYYWSAFIATGNISALR